MIQRVQSIFLFIAAIIPIVLIFIPLGFLSTDGAQYVYNSISLKENVPEGLSVVRNYYVAFCLALTTVLSAIALFSFKNRVRQMRIISITEIVFLITLFIMLWVCPDMVYGKFFSARGETFAFDYNYVPLIALIVVEAVSLFLANRFVRKDEMLVRSADRLR